MLPLAPARGQPALTLGVLPLLACTEPPRTEVAAPVQPYADGTTLTLEIDGAGDGEHLVSAPDRAWPGEVTARCDGQDVDVTREAGRLSLRCEGSRLELSGE